MGHGPWVIGRQSRQGILVVSDPCENQDPGPRTHDESARTPFQSPRVRHVIDLVMTGTQIVHRHQIEPVFIARASVAQAPEQRDAGDEALLETTDRLQSRPAHCRVPSLDLDEGHQIAPASDQIDVVVSQAEAMRLDVPTAGREVRQSNAFSPNAAELTRVFPFGGRGKSTDACHQGSIGSAGPSTGIPAVRHRTKSWRTGEVAMTAAARTRRRTDESGPLDRDPELARRPSAAS
jgi:hypothetical protein